MGKLNFYPLITLLKLPYITEHLGSLAMLLEWVGLSKMDINKWERHLSAIKVDHMFKRFNSTMKNSN